MFVLRLAPVIIKKKRSEGMTQSEIAQEFGCSQPKICNIQNRKAPGKVEISERIISGDKKIMGFIEGYINGQ